MKNSVAAQSSAERHLLARLVAGLLDRLHDEVERGLRALQVRREAALVADIGVVAGVLQALLQRVEDFRAPAHGVAQRRRADRHDHEFLEVDRVVGMRAAIDDVHHRHRQHVRVRAADIAVERQAGGFRRGLGDRQRHAEDGVGAEPALVRRAVELDHRLVDVDLVLGFHAADRLEDLAVDGLDRLLDALAEIARAAVAQFDRLMRAGRGAGRNRGAAHRAVLEHDVDLDGRVAAAVQNFAADDVDDGGHDGCPSGKAGDWWRGTV